MPYVPVSHPIQACSQCGQLFKPKTVKSAYCSSTCRENAKSLRFGPKCFECGAAMHKSRDMAGRPTCNECRRKRPGYKGSGPKPNEHWNCILCNAECERPATKGQRPRYCGNCRVRDWITPTRRLALYERDRWICWLCLESVDRSLIGTRSPWRPSLDHVEPRSLGGSNDESNLRLAHQWCNCVRSDAKYEPEVFRASA